jgi:hypothetical protein
MAKGKIEERGGETHEEKTVVVSDERVIARKVQISAANFVDQGVEVQDIEGLPEEFKRGDTLTGFPPSPKFEKPGNAVFGYYVCTRQNVGPNNSRLYELAVPRKDEEPLTVAVWGSSALDRLIDSCFPPLVSGDKIAIIYLVCVESVEIGREIENVTRELMSSDG